MKKAHVKQITITDRIYIKKEDVEDPSLLTSLFTYDVGDEFVSNIRESDTHYIIPSNSYYKLTWDDIIDNRNFNTTDADLTFVGSLRSEQAEAVEQFFSKGRARSGLLQAPCGWGKTYSGCSIISRNGTNALVMVHTKLLFRQWIEELEKQIPTAKIGKIGDGMLDVQDITVGIYKSIYNNLDSLKDKFSLILVDETHLAPAEMFSNTLNGLNAKVKIGISATPRRKDGKHVFLPDYFSTFFVTAKDNRKLDNPSIKITKTDFKFNVLDPKRDWAKQINKICSNQDYLKFIAQTAIKDIANGRRPLILGERVQMLKELQALIPGSICVIGETLEEVRVDALAGLGEKYTAILSTKLFDEGISCHRLDTMYLTCPSNNPIKLEQRIGRIIREHEDAQKPLVRDFWLSGGFVARQQQKRLEWYKQRGYNIL